VNYTYDNANRLTQVTQGTSTVSLTYDAANRRASLTLPNGVAMSYSYDSASQLTGLSYTLGSSTLGNLAYSYDLAGRRAQVGGSFARTGLPLAVTTTAYNANNQLTQWGTANLFYDLNGNMTSDGVNSFVWNARNQLASMNLGAVSFQYDALGRRVGKTISGATTNYLYDDVNIVQELSGTPLTPSANLLTGLSVDERFIRTDAAGARNFLIDVLGSTLGLTDSSGTLQTQYTYEPFGNTAVSGSASGNPYQYTGRENDGTGLYFYRARYYSSAFQRFASEDPVGFNGGLNLYAYVADSPVSFVDPYGLDKQQSPRKPRPRPRWWPPGLPPWDPPPPPTKPPDEPPLPPPRDKDYDECLRQAAARRDQGIRDGRILQLVGGGLIELGAGVAYEVLPVVNAQFWELLIHGHGVGVGYAYTGALGPILAGFGPFGQGSADIANAWSQYYSDLISCAAAR
jgi:RHS repeat-associated protein